VVVSNKSAWRAINRAHWDEKVGIHLGPRGYDLTALREGRARFYPIEEAELGPVAGKRVLHLQCHFGSDTLKFAQRGPMPSVWIFLLMRLPPPGDWLVS
jgi:hypothetical protein